MSSYGAKARRRPNQASKLMSQLGRSSDSPKIGPQVGLSPQEDENRPELKAVRRGLVPQHWICPEIAENRALNSPAQYCFPGAVCDVSLQQRPQLPAEATSCSSWQYQEPAPTILWSGLQFPGEFVPGREPLTWNASAAYFSRSLLATLAEHYPGMALRQEARNPGHDKPRMPA